MNKYTVEEIEAIQGKLREIILNRDEYNFLGEWFTVSDNKDYDLLCTVEYMNKDGVIETLDRYVTK